MRKRNMLIGGLVLVLLVGVAFLYAIAVRDRETRVEFVVEDMRYEIVTSPLDQERGLGGRTSLPNNYGMLFVFSTPDKYGIWMKNMLVPIDIVWLSSAGEVVAIDANVDPQSYPKAFYPPLPVLYVLETRAGLASERGWRVGSMLALPRPYGP